MPQQTKVHRFKAQPSGSTRKRRRGAIKRVRVGARNPGATGQGSIRSPF
jgi:hypothetical protein